MIYPIRFECFLDLRTCERGFELAGELATALSRVEPLTTAQTAHMVKTFEDAMQRAGVGPTSSLPLDWNTILSQARTALTPAQLTALEQIQRRLEDERTLRVNGTTGGESR